jgi:hypothetical protein
MLFAHGNRLCYAFCALMPFGNELGWRLLFGDEFRFVKEWTI